MNFEKGSFWQGQGVVQIEANLVRSIPCVAIVYDKTIFWDSLARKKLVFHTEICENLRISWITNFKIRSFWSGQGVVQIKLNLGWSIPCVGKLYEKRTFCYSLPRKEVSFQYGNFWISRIMNLEKGSFWPGQGVVQIEANLVWSIPCVAIVYDKTIFWYSLARKKLVFHTEICENFWISRITNFENRSFWPGQGVVQIKANLVWSIPYVARV